MIGGLGAMRLDAIGASGARRAAHRSAAARATIHAARATLLAIAATLVAPGPAAAADATALWRALARGGHVALVRSALAPGVGDPPGARRGDCATQRNLSDAGRRQARALGAAFRTHGVRAARVLSSERCRALETARRLGLAPVEPAPALDPVLAVPATERAHRTEALRRFVREQRAGASVVLVTHPANIHALTGVAPPPGGIVVLQPLGVAGFRVLGTIAP